MTRVFGVLGHPIAHSLSPVMHTAALQALRVDALYTAFDVPPAFLRPAFRALVLAGLDGCNVTVPLKETILPLLDEVSPLARAVGSVNAVVVSRGRTIGYTTDGVGLRQALEELGWSARRMTRTVLLGAGGAARAAAWELARHRGNELTIANRHVDRARRLAAALRRSLPHARVRVAALRDVSPAGADLVINATSVGMRPGDRPPVDCDALSPTTLVYDLVYHRRTRLVEAARQRGCVAANGLSMLLYQGAESLRLWLHRRPPIDPMRNALQRALYVGHSS